MNIYITLDAEGVATITAREQVHQGTPEFAAMRRQLTGEINAAIQGARGAGAANFLVNEGHGKHRNVIPEKLDREAMLFTGREKRLHYMHAIDRGHDGMFMIGFHGGPDKRDAVLSHAFHVYDLHVNGQRFSEVGMGMGLAGHFDVPTLLVTGDEATCEEAKELVPNIETVAVKEGVSGVTAIHHHPDVAREMIEEGAHQAVERAGEIEPLKVETPVVIDIQLYTTLMADMHDYIPGCERTGSRSVRLEAEDFLQGFKLFLLSSTLSMTTKGLTVMV